ncbi:MAG TPA: HAD-IA family hydrolase [Candidatus Acidoferrales bacterium]|nr:HAD-IA family hydrolase [Candidatus Acidoferrales bacterium]
MIRAVFLDAGGVFHYPTEEGVRQALAEAGFELPRGALLRAHYTAMRDYDAAGGEPSAYVRGLVGSLGIPAHLLEAALSGLAAFFSQPRTWTSVIQDSIDALPALAATGVRLAVVSNSDGSVAERLAAEGILQVGPGRGVPVAAVIDSGRVGVAKPDPRIFEHALQAVGVGPQEAVHVGDSVLADVEGARAAGIRPFHLDPFAGCERDDHDHVASLRDLIPLLPHP